MNGLPETSLGKPSPTAIGFFLVFIVSTLSITYWAARRTQNTAQFFAAGGASRASRTAWPSPATS
jgi:Na+(H+)/acetate symporter ActP